MSSPARFKDLCLDADDHQRLADWWCGALGYARRSGPDARSEDPVLIGPSEGDGPFIWINHVPEPKTVKNRMHLDVVGSTEALVGMGATLLRARDTEVPWDVLTDPEGNEFCCFSE